MQSITVLGSVTGFLVILDGVYTFLYPPFGDEPQALALVAIGVFMILISLHMEKSGGPGEQRPQ
jgi:hypothetical protein